MLNIFNFNKTNKYELDDSNSFYDYSWFCSLDILDFEDIEIHIDGNDSKPYDRFLTLANNIINDFDFFYTRAIKYLNSFFPNHNNEYILSELYIGKFIFNNTLLLEGISFNFIYDELQYTVNFRYDDDFKYNKFMSFWPIGFSVRPL